MLFFLGACFSCWLQILALCSSLPVYIQIKLSTLRNPPIQSSLKTQYEGSAGFLGQFLPHPAPLQPPQAHDHQQLVHPPLHQTVLLQPLLLILPGLLLSLKLLHLQELPSHVHQLHRLSPQQTHLLLPDHRCTPRTPQRVDYKVAVGLVVDENFAMVAGCLRWGARGVGEDSDAGFVDGVWMGRKVLLGMETSVRKIRDWTVLWCITLPERSRMRATQSQCISKTASRGNCMLTFMVSSCCEEQMARQRIDPVSTGTRMAAVWRASSVQRSISILNCRRNRIIDPSQPQICGNPKKI